MLKNLLRKRTNVERTPNKTDFRTKFTIFLLYGFLFLDKTFVYLAFPLTALLLFDRRALFDRVYNALTKRGKLSPFAWVLLISTMYGLAEVVYGYLSGYKPLTVVQILVFNICPWFLYLGIHVGIQRPTSVREYVHILAWFHAITTPLYYLFLRNASADGSESSFLQPGSGALVLIGLFCFEQKIARYWFPILVCSFDTLASEIRADWVGLAIAITVWGIATKRIARVASMAGIMVALLAIGFMADVRIPALPGRGGEISARDTVGRAVAGFDPELAQEYSNNSRTYAGTVAWRQNWWKAIREEVFEKPSTTVFGLGYGYPIKDLVPYLKGIDVRSPHSVFYFTLAYSGFVGVAIFALLIGSLFRMHWQTFKKTGQIFGFTSLIFLLVDSLLGNFFEAPQHAAPTYLLWGMCIAPLFADRLEGTLAPPREAHDGVPRPERVAAERPFRQLRRPQSLTR